MVGENSELGLSMHTGSSFLWAARDDSVASWEKSLYPSVDNPDVVAKLQVGFLDGANDRVNQNNTFTEDPAATTLDQGDGQRQVVEPLEWVAGPSEEGG